jgi:hypothetical protein
MCVRWGLRGALIFGGSTTVGFRLRCSTRRTQTVQRELVSFNHEALRCNMQHISRAAVNIENARAAIATKVVVMCQMRRFVSRALTRKPY